MAKQCGDEGYVRVGVTRLDVTTWEGEEVAEHSETTNTGSGGYKEAIPCKLSMTGTVSADFDPLEGPKTAPTIVAGTPVALELHTAASGNYTIGTANVLRLRWSNPAGDKVSYTFDFESTGAYSYA